MAASPRPDERDPFAVLGVPRDCTSETLHRAYRTLARRYHPDVNADAGAAERMRRINAAFVAAKRQLRIRAATHVSVSVSTAHTSPSSPESPETTAPTSTAPASAASTPSAPVGEHGTAAAQAGQPHAASPPDMPDTPNMPDETVERDTPATTSQTGAPDRIPTYAAPSHLQPTTQPATGSQTAPAWRVRAGYAGRDALMRRHAWRRWRLPWPLWGVGVLALAALPVLALLFFVHVGWLGGGRHTTPPSVTGFALGRATTMQWPGTGSVTLNERAIANLPSGAYSAPSWSFDGRYLALTEGDPSGRPDQASIVLLDASGQAVRTFPGFSVRWSPRSDQLAVLMLPAGASVPELHVVDASSGSDRLLVRHASQHIAWSPDGGSLLYSVDSLRGLRLIDIQTLRTTLLYDAPQSETAHIIALGWFSNTAVLCTQSNGASNGGTTRMVLLDTQTGQLTPLPPALASTRQAVAWDTARGQVLYLSQPPGQGKGEPLLLDRATGAVQTLASLRDMSILAGWSADNRWMAGASVTTEANGTQQSTLCLLSMPTQLPSASWVTRCLPVTGTIAGLRWENSGVRLTYLRATGSTAAPAAPIELRELTITTGQARPTARVPMLPVPVMAAFGVFTAGVSLDMALGALADSPVARPVQWGHTGQANAGPNEFAQSRTKLPASGHTSCSQSVAFCAARHAGSPRGRHAKGGAGCQHVATDVSVRQFIRSPTRHPLTALGGDPDAHTRRQQSPARRAIAGQYVAPG